MNKYLLCAALLSLLLLGSCRSSRNLSTDKKPEQDSSIVVKDTQSAPQPQQPSQPVKPKPQAKPPKPKAPFTTFSGNFSCTVQNFTVNGQVRIMSDSIIWISANKIIELGRLKATPDSVFAYVKPYNQYLRCNYADLKKMYHIDINYATLQSILTGGKVQSTLVEATYSNPTTLNNRSYPQCLNLKILDRRAKSTAVVKYSKLRVDVPLTYPLVVPSDATPLKLGQ